MCHCQKVVSSDAFSSLPQPTIKVSLEMIGVETDDPDRPFYVSIKNCAVKIKN